MCRLLDPQLVTCLNSIPAKNQNHGFCNHYELLKKDIEIKSSFDKETPGWHGTLQTVQETER